MTIPSVQLSAKISTSNKSPLKRGDYNSRVADKFVVRMPEGLRDRVADAAHANKRSSNAEIITRLELSLIADGYLPGTVETLLTELATPSVTQGWIPAVGQAVTDTSERHLGVITNIVRRAGVTFAEIRPSSADESGIATLGGLWVAQIHPACTIKPFTIGA